MDLNSEQTVILAYFYTSPYNNRLGCFYYPFDKTAGDLDYDQNKGIIDSSIEKLHLSMAMLKESGFICHIILNISLYEILIKGNR